MNMKTNICLLALVAVCAGASRAGAAEPADGELGRGHRWVRSHPFMLSGLVLTSKTFDGKEYAACNMNTVLAWKAVDRGIFAETVRTGLPWHGHAKPRRFYGADEPRRFDKVMQSAMIDLVQTYPGCQGWLIWDEPEDEVDIEIAAKIAAWAREAFPDQLVYTRANGGGGREFQGLEPKKPSYGEYLRMVTSKLKPDVLMITAYPFFKEPFGDRVPLYRFRWLKIREAALEAGIPYWSFLQAYSEAVPGNNNDRRRPSESDVRMQAFTALALGFTGIDWFIYSPGFERTMIDEDGTPTPLYYDIARVNREILNLGQTLRFLASTDLRFIAGRHEKGGRTVSNDADRFIAPWERDACLEYGVGGIVTMDEGIDKDALVGLFKDDDGQRYFILVNLSHGEGAAANEKLTTFTLDLAPGVTGVRRLSRQTGAVEDLVALDGRLHVTLPGGTGDLFTVGDEPFPGLGQ